MNRTGKTATALAEAGVAALVEARMAVLVRGVLLIALAVAVAVLLGNHLITGTFPPTMWVVAAAVPVTLVLLELVRRGRVRAATLALIFLLYAVIAGVVLTRGSVRVSASSLVIVIGALSGMVLGRSAMVVSLGAGVALLGGLALAEARGLLGSGGSGSLFSFWLAISAFAIATGAVLFFGRRMAEEALAQAGRALDERRQAEEAVSRSEARFRSIFENANTGMAFCDAAGLMVDFNEELRALLGFEADALRRMNIADFTHPDDIPQERIYFEEVLAGRRERYRMEKRYVGAGGGVIWVDLSVAAIRNAQGEAEYFVGVVNDITERKHAEEEVRRLTAEAERARAQREADILATNQALEQRVEARTAELAAANRELEAFSYSVSHDLRAPLRHIDGYAQMLADELGGDLGEQGRELLSRMRRSVARMNLLIEDLLELSRVGRTQPRPQQVDLSLLAREIMASFEADEPGRAVETAVAEGIAVTADAGLIRNALENLLGNAWKYTGRKSQGRIEFGAAHSGENGLHYFVRDNGAGFDMKYADKLFQPFQRLHGKNEFEGTGVGLAIVQRIIHRHGGRIWAEAQPEAGATFYFTLGEVAAPR
jgi:PAS domain S-box-containing protein